MPLAADYRKDCPYCGLNTITQHPQGYLYCCACDRDLYLEKHAMIYANKLVNLTPHVIRFADDEGHVYLEIPPSGEVARVTAKPVVCSAVYDFTGPNHSVIPVVRVEYGPIEGLPEQSDDERCGYNGKVFVVSRMVAEVAKRPDVLCPDTGESAVRRAGQVYAVRSLQSFA